MQGRRIGSTLLNGLGRALLAIGALLGGAGAIAQDDVPRPVVPFSGEEPVRPSSPSAWEPVFTAPLVHPPGPEASPAGQVSRTAYGDPADVLRIFDQGCIDALSRGQSVVDWALSQGFEPTDVRQSASDESLLGGRTGAVLSAPGSEGRVLIVAADDGHCSVWADGMSGPGLRTALRAWLDALAARGLRLQPAIDRNLERAGAWRNQLQWRLQMGAGRSEFDVGAVTTLAAAPGTQLLHMRPVSALGGPAAR